MGRFGLLLHDELNCGPFWRWAVSAMGRFGIDPHELGHTWNI